MIFKSMDATLEAQDMLQRVIFEVGPVVIVRFDAKVTLEQLIFGGRGEWAAAYSCEHLRAAVIVRYGHHCCHKTKLGIVRHGEKVTCLPLPPFG